MKRRLAVALVVGALTGALAMAAALAGAAGSNAPLTQIARLSTVPGRNLLWFVTAPAFARLHELNPVLVDAALNHPGAYMLGGDRSARAHWGGRVRAQYESYAAFAQNVQQRTIDPAVTAVVYNPEVWDLTSEAEQRDPVGYARIFTQLAHQHGWTSIIAPSCGLLRKMPGFWRGSVFTGCAAWLLAQIAPYADIVDFEAQPMERNPAVYGQQVAEASMLVKRANPRVKLVAQLSSGLAWNVTPDVLFRDAQAAAPYVDGFWLNIDSAKPASVALADAFLQRFNGGNE